MAKTYSLWASVVRIMATLLIFLFHYEGLYKRSLAPFDMVAITMFLLISGYFSCQHDTSIHKWFIKRLKQILIPYWPIIIFVLLVNHFINYKPTTAFNNVMIFSGLSYFIKDPVYVIAWFITLILIFYIDLYLFRLIKFLLWKIVFFVMSYMIICFYFHVSAVYFFSFYLGYYLRYKNTFAFEPRLIQRLGLEKMNQALFQTQSYCYAFFLLHGGMLLFIIKVCKLPEGYSLTAAFLLTFLSAYVYKNLIDRLIRKIPI